MEQETVLEQNTEWTENGTHGTGIEIYYRTVIDLNSELEWSTDEIMEYWLKQYNTIHYKLYL